MKTGEFRNTASLIFCAFLVATTSAQAEEIGGGGTAGYIPQFIGTQRIGNSNVFQASNGNVGINTTDPEYKFIVKNFDDTNALGQPSTAIYGVSTSSRAFTIGIRGDVFSGAAYGAVGVNYGNDSNSGGGGVLGLISTTVGFTTAIRGTANGTSGPSAAVYGEQFSPDGEAGLFISRNGGTILQGNVSQNPDITVFRVDGRGRVFADGGFQAHGADFAESMSVKEHRNMYAAGDLLVIDPTASRRVDLARQPYSTLVAGIFSTKPGLLGTTRKVDESAPQNEVPLAIVGIVPCKVTAENGSIEIGDLLVTSSTPGHAMKGTDRSRLVGAVVGKALEPLANGNGVVQVLVTLQ
jgi:hypothetical protein